MSFSPVNLWQDLRHRNVFKVAAIYAASAWLVIQVADVLIERIPAIPHPDRAMALLISAVIAGFPMATILAWLFEIGPEGVVRTKPGSTTGVSAIVVSLGLLAAGTAGLYSLLARDDSPRPPPGDVVPSSVAVMPFADLSTGGGALNLGAGIAAVLRAHLGQLGTLRVISDRSTGEVFQEGLDVAAIRGKLRVPRLLEGSIQRSGDRLRVTAQLVDTDSTEAVWSQVFEGTSAEIFEIQDKIVQAVADAMTQGYGPITASEIYDLDAYDLYLLAKDSFQSAEMDGGFAEAIDLFEQALDLDPQMAPGWAGLAAAIYWHGQQGFVDREEATDKSWEYSDRALAIDPQNSDAYAIQIRLYAVRREFDSAEEAYSKAIQYNPSSPIAYLYFGASLSAQGKFEQALAVLMKGLELHPYKAGAFYKGAIANARMNLGEYEEPMRILGEIYLDQRGEVTEAQNLRRMAESALSKYYYDEAAAFFAMERRSSRGIARARANYALASLGMRRYDEAEVFIAEAEDLLAKETAIRPGLDSDQAYVEFTRAMIYLATEDTRGLLGWINELNARIEKAPDDDYLRWRLWDLVFLNLALRRLEDAVRTSAILVRDPTDIENYTMAAFAHRELSRREAARGNTRRADEIATQAAGYLERARQGLDSTLRLASGFPDLFVFAAAYHAVAGANEQALDMLERAYDAHYRHLAYIQLMPMFDSIRSDPRYLDVVRKISDDLAAMSARVDKAAATGNWEGIVARYLTP